MSENNAIKAGGPAGESPGHGVNLSFFSRALAAVRRRVRPRLATADRCLRHIAGPSSFLSSLYYALFSRAFGREHRGVLAGRKRFAEETARPRGSSAFLRRSTHRLEKGLLMRPRRPVFGLDFIREMVDCYERALELAAGRDCCGDAELQWPHEVLAEYFKVVASHPRVDPLKERFSALPMPTNGDARATCVPYRRDLSTASPISYDELLQLSIHRRSVRWFQQRAVPREMIDKAIKIAALSPSACNRQPFEFRVFDDPGWVRKVANSPYGTSGYADNIPVMIVVVGQLRCYSEERDRHLIYIDGALASMSLLYALEVQGLSSCCINWPDVEERERELAGLMNLDPDERGIMLIAAGYPDPEGMVASSRKKPLDAIRRYNFE